MFVTSLWPRLPGSANDRIGNVVARTLAAAILRVDLVVVLRVLSISISSSSFGHRIQSGGFSTRKRLISERRCTHKHGTVATPKLKGIQLVGEVVDLLPRVATTAPTASTRVC